MRVCVPCRVAEVSDEQSAPSRKCIFFQKSLNIEYSISGIAYGSIPCSGWLPTPPEGVYKLLALIVRYTDSVINRHVGG